MRPQVIDDLVVVGLERVDDLEYQRHIGRPHAAAWACQAAPARAAHHPRTNW
jgi:hypothetical protein